MEEKVALLKEVTPLAVLKAITPKAQKAIITSCLGKDIIGIWHFPFRIGRESRFKKIDGLFIVHERERQAGEKPNNDFYLVDDGELLHISREHFQIEKKGEKYFLRDRNSTCGTAINDIKIETLEKVQEIKDGDIITIGCNHSPYKYQLIVF